VAYRRLGFFALQEGDVERGLDYLEQAREADPDEPETLFALGDVYSFLGRSADALAAWEAYAGLPGAIHDEALENRLERARTLAPLEERVEEDPSEENLMALADAHWALDERDAAASLYFQVIQEVNPRNEQAVRRLGMALFFAGRSGDAISLLEISRHVSPENLEGLLFLGNAYFSEGRYAEAIEVWEDYVEVSGGPERAGRVPSLIEDARGALVGGETAQAPREESPVVAVGDDPVVATEASELYAQKCASCHGLAGEGGVGPRLAGNPGANDALSVRRVIARGRGMMPAFGHLSDDELDGLARYVVERIYPEGTSR
jgi:mono/diheme cytochrome c family protein/Flp pilus assembly protein TadD